MPPMYIARFVLISLLLVVNTHTRTQTWRTIFKKSLFTTTNLPSTKLSSTNQPSTKLSSCITDRYAAVGAPFTTPDNLQHAGAVYTFTLANTHARDLSSHERSRLDDNIPEDGSDDRSEDRSRSQSSFAWIPHQRLTGPSLSADAQFGSSVAMDDVAMILVVGAAGFTSQDSPKHGAVFVYTMDGQEWIYHQILQSPEILPSGIFGLALGVDARMIRVAMSVENKWIYTYVFNETLRVWSFRSSEKGIVHDGDYSPSGRYRIRAEMDELHTRAYVTIETNELERRDFQAQHVRKLQIDSKPTPTYPAYDEEDEPEPILNNIPRANLLGYSVVMYRSVAVISQPGCPKDNSRCNGGQLLVYINTDTRWELKQTMRYRNGNPAAMLGSSLAITPQYLVAAAKHAYLDGKESATVHLFIWSENDQQFSRFATYRPKPAVSFEGFEVPIACYQNTTAVGLPRKTSQESIPNSGAVYIYQYPLSVTRDREAAVITSTSPKAYDYFGATVCLGQSHLSVSTRPSSGSDAGVHIFTFSSRQWNFVQVLHQHARRGFGWCILCSSWQLYISAIKDSTRAIELGSVIQYKRRRDGKFQLVEVIQPEESTPYLHYGYTMAMSPSHFVIGTDTCPSGVGCSTRGAAYVFTKEAKNWVDPHKYSHGAKDGSDRYGSAATTYFGHVVIGAPLHKDESVERGAIYLYS
eukprot:TRINITY_DN7242_c0_g1_i1.p1 TRINITY_DN7242_c0_g1~~TRINITY_DN7242_c0_g1_i1.p1  ORF type:complete len:694 (+),score=109.08 TRINITY_DN7242_c0_g1_i1:43-2124(+)